MRRAVPVFAMALFMLALFCGVSAAELTAIANHSLVEMNFDYHGSAVSLSGIADPDVELVATISSQEAHQELKRKGRVGGVIWMNVADVSFEHLPNVYFLRSTKAPQDILLPEETAKYSIGYGTLKEKAGIEPFSNEAERDRLFGEFVKYKEASHLYSTNVGAFSYTKGDGSGKYFTKIEWPYQVPPGHYQVNVYAVREGRVVETAKTGVIVKRVGIIERLADMAQNNGAAYGVVAVVVAIGAGFGAGLIFRKSGGAH